MITILTLGVIVSAILIWSIPKLQMRGLSSVDDPIKKRELENELRKTIVQIVGGFSLIISLLFTWHQLVQSKSKDIADQINKTISLMGDENEYVRIGAIYSMEQLAVNHEDSSVIIVDILTSYVRNTFPWSNKALPEHRNEVSQAAMSVISNAIRTAVNVRVDLSNTDLRRLDLQNRALSRCILIDVHFDAAELTKANFDNSDLTGSVFDDANLDHASFVRANLSHASFAGATLAATDFSGADLRGVTGIKREDITSQKAIISQETKLSKELL